MLGFFSYFYDEIDRPCRAAYGNTEPLPADTGDVMDATQAIDVQKNFRMAIRFGFYLTLLNFSRVIIS